eukprot:superscaffoldBa00003052_g15981
MTSQSVWRPDARTRRGEPAGKPRINVDSQRAPLLGGSDGLFQPITEAHSSQAYRRRSPGLGFTRRLACLAPSIQQGAMSLPLWFISVIVMVSVLTGKPVATNE